MKAVSDKRRSFREYMELQGYIRLTNEPWTKDGVPLSGRELITLLNTYEKEE